MKHIAAGSERGQVGDIYWHVHHEVLCEVLTEPIQNRIDYIKSSKPEAEIETRLWCMTPILHLERLPKERREGDAKGVYAYAKYLPPIEKLHKEEHPNCPWNGKTIFPKAK